MDKKQSWLTEILDHLAIAKNVEEDKSSGVIVCQVPPYWRFGKEDAFIPQFVGLGLYHHFRPELPLTDKFKLVSPLMLNGFLNSNLDEQLLLYNLEKIDIKGFYKVEVSPNNYTLYLRGLTVDALFLLSFIGSKLNTEQYIYSLFVRHGMPVVNAAQVELTVGAIKNDVFMLENQIPISFLMQIMEDFNIQGHQNSLIDRCNVLGSALLNFCEASCPLVKFEKLSPWPDNYDHLLCFMYHMMVPADLAEPTERPESSNENNSCFSFICLVFRFILRIPFLFFSIALIGGKLCLEDFSHLFGMLLQVLLPGVSLRSLSIIIIPLLNIFHDFEASIPVMKHYATIRRLEQQENQGLQEPGPGQGPWNMSCEAISATELHNCGIGFCGFGGGISSIEFNDQHVLRLPKMHLDVNSEVIIRNLLAYEQLTESGYELVLSSYIELMKSLIDTPKDAELLVREKVIETELSAEVVHQLFNGLKNRSIRPVYNSQLFSEVLKLLVKYNENRKIKRAVTKFSICSGKIVIVLAVLIFLVLTAVQLYCSAFGCAPASEFGPEVGKYGTNNLFLNST
jgi:hypothetical protein